VGTYLINTEILKYGNYRISVYIFEMGQNATTYESNTNEEPIEESVENDQNVYISSTAFRRPFIRRIRPLLFKKCTHVYSGILCLRKAVSGSDRCVYHPKELKIIAPLDDIKPLKEIEIFNTECPICLESFVDTINGVHKTECGHMWHLQCMEGMYKAECPTCRRPVTNLSEDVLLTIDKNAARNRRETEAVNFGDLLSNLRQQNIEENLSTHPHQDGGTLNMNVDTNAGEMIRLLGPLLNQFQTSVRFNVEENDTGEINDIEINQQIPHPNNSQDVRTMQRDSMQAIMRQMLPGAINAVFSVLGNTRPQNFQ